MLQTMQIFICHENDSLFISFHILNVTLLLRGYKQI